ncbi:uncharacterized protein LOC110830401 [Zootermopsis nevadensis]|uniref:Uncharacterized protein n=1 Tax=Zootermopsis nevadensis TaxID=136037 RepID=A0A067R6J0_ZOONE|nr:uncharacterized protein LOC110830401 [Zootermopsis nevadensis]XP_021920975.1 uncharacterized protein LOC110830401 [Zootermopsis nevadensis]XP_021920976.1 uncharacterized protein LOC110830401 [Zootermopsis nevadensis]XP_021920977.1 uncharacterized protein LOC110830401 [Zootermopsis nevadensis]XP_021920978.1 uncharacterized protein LOC110830401 [Zootermopsis nevadensis]KDR18920.1 hypothetical protein L798_06658 [Zootermopsis nevadensis]
MSSKDMILKQLDLVRSETVSHHLQRPVDKISSSSITLTLKSEEYSVEDSDLFINGTTETQRKDNVLRNGTIDNCKLERAVRTIEAVSFLSDFDAPADLEATSCTSHKHLHDEPIKVLGTSSDCHRSSDPIQSSCPLGTSSDKLRSTSGPNVSRVLHVADEPSDIPTPLDQDGLLDPVPVQSQLIPCAPTHNRSLSQTTSQLTNLKESTKSENFEDICVSNLLQGSRDTYPVNISGNKNLSDAPSLGSLVVDKPQISLSDICDLKTVQDPRSPTEESVGSDGSHASEETDLESFPDQSQCPSLESEVDLPHLTHSPYPDWKLDRRESGHLYWRRDSATLNGTDPSSRVKFRYDIEIHEFESRSSGAEDFAEEDDDACYDSYDDYDDDDIGVRKVDKLCEPKSQTPACRKDESSSLGSTAVLCVVAVTGIIVMASYRWFLGILSLI